MQNENDIIHKPNMGHISVWPDLKHVFGTHEKVLWKYNSRMDIVIPYTFIWL